MTVATDGREGLTVCDAVAYFGSDIVTVNAGATVRPFSERLIAHPDP